MKRLSLFFVAASFVFVSGCVSTGTHQMALDESEARRVQLENVSSDLEAARKTIHDLSEEVSTLNTRVDELTLRNNELNELVSAKASDVESLREEKESLSVEKEKELISLKKTYEDLMSEMEQEIAHGDIKITQAVDKLSVNFVEKILFDSGKAEIKSRGLEILKRVGDILKKVSDRQIRVEGHTDNVPIGSRLRETFPTNWELSTARATNVVRYLQDTVGVDPAVLSAAGYSEYKPVDTNDTLEGKAQNRRIEIVLLPLDVDRVLQELKQ